MNNDSYFVEGYKKIQAKRKAKEDAELKEIKARAEIREYIRKLPQLYKTIDLNDLLLKTDISLEELKGLIEEMVLNKEIIAKINGQMLDFKEGTLIINQKKPEVYLDTTKIFCLHCGNEIRDKIQKICEKCGIDIKKQ